MKRRIFAASPEKNIRRNIRAAYWRDYNDRTPKNRYEYGNRVDPIYEIEFCLQVIDQINAGAETVFYNGKIDLAFQSLYELMDDIDWEEEFEVSSSSVDYDEANNCIWSNEIDEVLIDTNGRVYYPEDNY